MNLNSPILEIKDLKASINNNEILQSFVWVTSKNDCLGEYYLIN